MQSETYSKFELPRTLTQQTTTQLQPNRVNLKHQSLPYAMSLKASRVISQNTKVEQPITQITQSPKLQNPLRFSKLKNIWLIVMAIFIILSAATIFYFFYLRKPFRILSERNYKLSGHKQYIRVQNFQLTTQNGQDQVTFGQFIHIENQEQDGGLKSEIVKVSNKQLGVILKAYSLSSFLIEIDINTILFQLQKMQSPTQAQILLAQSSLNFTQGLKIQDFYKELANQLHQIAASAINMDGNEKVNVAQLYKGFITAQGGYQLQRKTKVSSRLLSPFTTERSLWRPSSSLKRIKSQLNNVVQSGFKQIQQIMSDRKAKSENSAQAKNTKTILLAKENDKKADLSKEKNNKPKKNQPISTEQIVDTISTEQMIDTSKTGQRRLRSEDQQTTDQLSRQNTDAPTADLALKIAILCDFQQDSYKCPKQLWSQQQLTLNQTSNTPNQTEEDTQIWRTYPTIYIQV